MQVRHREVFTSIHTEGAILPADLLQRIFSGDSDLAGLRPKDYHLAEGEKLNEAINRSWNILQGYWKSFQNGMEKLAEGELGTTLVRERWLLPLFQGLGYGRLLTHKAIEIENKTYPISHSWHKTPIHLVGCKVDLDLRMAGVAGAARSSPHSLVQELLNRSDDHLWAFLSNGLRLRILRDNLSLTRQAYVEFDLETMMEGEIYSDFVLLWLLCHQSRVEGDKPEESWLEKWSKTAQEQGTRALDQLRDGVEEAIKALGSGFLKHPLNGALREKLKAGQLDKQDYYRQILRLIYRFLFLFVAEDRDMLFDPDSEAEAQEFYIEHYSTTRLRRIAEKFRGTRHSDLYQGFRLVSEKLGDHGCPELGLPALGSFLFSKNKALPDLQNSEISNEDFLNAIRALAYTLDQGTLRAVDYKNLGSEEFGSVYESLLELHPDINIDAGIFELKTVSGHERKTSGSYYTPSSLVQCLLDSALDPVLEEAASNSNPEKSIMDLKICDPASGSGHFLIAAAHRVARRLAAIRTGDEEPAPDALRAALRDIISHCIYGVDLNPMAVELCKVSLWMESLDPGKALSFLDHKIRCGNSLLGATPRLIVEGIPNVAFTPIEGDDPIYCSALKRNNQQERQGQTTLWADMVAEDAATYGSLSDRYRIIEKMDDSSVDEVRMKEVQYKRLSSSNMFSHTKLIYDMWCANFVWRKTREAFLPITQDLFRRLIRDSKSIPHQVLEEVLQIAEQYKFFHWHLEFPDVFSIPKDEIEPENELCGWNGGFDVVLGNPPWERIKLQEKEWYSEKKPEIANAPNAASRRRMIKKLETEEPALYKAFMESKRKAEGESHIIRNSGLNPLCGRGDINTYAIFAERKRLLISPNGCVGTLVPSGIATDDTTKVFFQDLMIRKNLLSLYDFENRKKLFPAIDSRMKFCLLTMRSHNYQIEHGADFIFFAHSVEDLKDLDRRFTLTLEEIALLNPNTKTCPIFRTRRNAELTKDIYRKVPVLVKEKTNENPWGISFLRMFDMANDSKLFHPLEELEKEGYELNGNIFLNNHLVYFPLYEAKMFQQYDHRAASVVISETAKQRQGQPRYLSDQDHTYPDYYPIPRYWIGIEDIKKKLPKSYLLRWFLSFKKVTSTTNERTMIASIIPFSGVGDTAPLILSEIKNPTKLPLLLSIFNSFIFDFAARQKVGGTAINHYLLQQFPALTPAVYREESTLLIKIIDKLPQWIINRVVELSYTAWDLQDFARDCEYDFAPFKWDKERRFLIRCELDAVYFHLYRIERPNVDNIMETFPIVKRKDLQKYGEYRTKLTILDIYDRMQHAIESGKPYQTILDPPPAHPSVAHLPKDGSRRPGSMLHLSDLLHSTPTESSILVQISEEYLVEGIDSSGLAKFRILKEGERMTRECQVVIIRHPELQKGDEKVKIAAGKFNWAEQRDVETGKPFILITLRTKGAPVRLKLSKDEWKQFRPLAVLDEE